MLKSVWKRKRGKVGSRDPFRMAYGTNPLRKYLTSIRIEATIIIVEFARLQIIFRYLDISTLPRGFSWFKGV